MRYDILKRYEQDLENGTFYKMLLDNYELNFEKNEYYKVTKDDKLIEINGLSSEEDKQWIKERDLFSGYISSNKRISHSNANILSNNYMTLIIKLENFQQTKDHINPKIQIDKYFSDLYDFFYSSSTQSIKRRRFNLEKVDSEEFDICKTSLIKAFDELSDKYTTEYLLKMKGELKPKDYNSLCNKKIRIFYDADLLKYKKEINKYIITKIFISNDIVEKHNNIYYGIPAIGQSVNAKKIFSFNNTLPNKYNFVLPLKECIWLYWIDIYIRSSSSRSNKIYIENLINSDKSNLTTNNDESLSKNKLMMSTQMSKTGLLINDVSIYNDSTDKTFTLYNFMGIKDFDEEDNVKSFRWLYGYLLNLINNNNQKVKYNTKLLGHMLLEYNGYEYKYYEKIINKFLVLIYSQVTILNYAISMLLNIKLSLKKQYVEDYDVNIEEFRDKINEKVINCNELENDNEFLFLYGQLYRYVVSHSRSLQHNIELYNLPLKIQNETKLKALLKEKVNYYSFGLNMKMSKLTNALSLIYSYNLKNKFNLVNNDYLHIGLFYNNLFYMKNNGGENNVRNEE